MLLGERYPLNTLIVHIIKIVQKYKVLVYSSNWIFIKNMNLEIVPVKYTANIHEQVILNQTTAKT